MLLADGHTPVEVIVQTPQKNRPPDFVGGPVHLIREDGSLTDSRAEITVKLLGERQVLGVPAGLSWLRWWHVLDVDGATSRVLVVNWLLDRAPWEVP